MSTQPGVTPEDPNKNAPEIANGALSPELEPGNADREKRSRTPFLLAILILLLLCCCLTAFLFFQYVKERKPLPELIPQPVNFNYPPHYLFSIYGVDKPVATALSPDGSRLYVAETDGSRLIKIFDREGNFISSFSPPGVNIGQRAPVFIAVNKDGKVFVSDRLQHVIYVYSADGKYIDTILAPGLTLSEYVAKHIENLPEDVIFQYNIFSPQVNYRIPGNITETLPGPDPAAWSPLGIRFDRTGNLWVTSVYSGEHVVRDIPADILGKINYREFDYSEIMFGSKGSGANQFDFPIVAVMDYQERLHVLDGNNGRVALWDNQGKFITTYGNGTGAGALSLPRGSYIDSKDRLHIVDAVGQDIKVYDVSGIEPVFLFSFGEFGLGDGQFNFPNDIVLDAFGRLYIADRENDRIQVWSY